jgi:hypothetical protein
MSVSLRFKLCDSLSTLSVCGMQNKSRHCLLHVCFRHVLAAFNSATSTNDTALLCLRTALACADGRCSTQSF